MHFPRQAQYKRHVHQSCYVRRSGHWFPERGCILEHQIFRFAEMILRDRCSTSYDLASLFRGRRSTLDRWSGTIAKRIGTRPSALHSTFHFWRIAELFRFWCCQLRKLRKSRRLVLFLILSSAKTEDVSQNSFVFKLADRQVDRQLQLQVPLHYTTTTTTSANIPRYIAQR